MTGSQKNRTWVILAFAMILFLVPGFAVAGGYLVVSNTGVPFAWPTSTPIPRDIDGGPFGSPSLVPNPVAFTEAATDIWSAEPTLALTFATTSIGTLSADGDVNTAAEFAAIDNVQDGKSPIVFDADGSLFAALGFPGGVIGFASVEFVNVSTFTITESLQAYNGNFIDGDAGDGFEFTNVSEMSATITHEQGHALNFDHTQVNGQFFIGDTNDQGFAVYGSPPSGVGMVNIMFPFSLGGGQNATTPNRDDLSTAEFIYGNGTGATGTISGTVFESNGTTFLQGANVIARNTTDPFFGAVSTVSGYLYNPSGLGPGPTPTDLKGSYDLTGLTPGTDYTIEITQINPAFTGGSGVGPVDPPISIPVEEFYNGSSEAGTNPPDDPSTSVTVIPTSIGIDFISNDLAPVPATDALIWNPVGGTLSTGLLTRRVAKNKGVTVSPANVRALFDSKIQSANAIQTALNTIGISNQISSSLPSNLSDFTYLLVVLGQYGANYVIPANGPDATAIEAFIATGGKVYMEGGDVWFWDPTNEGGHNFNATFGIIPISDGAQAGELNKILGSNFAQSQDFDYGGGDSYPDHINPTDTGFLVHSNDTPSFNCGIANVVGTTASKGRHKLTNSTIGRTIGTSFEFGQLVDGVSPATRTQLMQNYINFFDGGNGATGLVFRVERTTGKVYSAGSFTGGGADVAERINVSDPVEPGDLVELDPARPGHYRKARTIFSHLIAGVISTEPGFTLGNSPEEIKSMKDSASERTGSSAATKRPMLALIGRVRVKATTENGTIHPGDLLILSSIPGYAMRCIDAKKCPGTIIGKALDSLENGVGLIEALVMLR